MSLYAIIMIYTQHTDVHYSTFCFHSSFAYNIETRYECMFVSYLFLCPGLPPLTILVFALLYVLYYTHGTLEPHVKVSNVHLCALIT